MSYRRAAITDFTMRFHMLFFVVVLSCLCLALTQGFYDDCCLKYVKDIKAKNQKHAVNYKYQRTDGGCNIRAVIFIMRKGRKLCANPSEKWVQELMANIDKRRNKHHLRSSSRG